MPCGSQGCRHIPCAVLKIESVAHRYLADGTAECACYFGADGTAECACYLDADGTAECACYFGADGTAECAYYFGADGTAECACYFAAKQANRTPARVPATCGLLLAWQLTSDRPAELSAGRCAEGVGGVIGGVRWVPGNGHPCPGV